MANKYWEINSSKGTTPSEAKEERKENKIGRSLGGGLEVSSTVTERGSLTEDRTVQREGKNERSWHLTKSVRELRLREKGKLHKTLSTE